MCGKEFNVAIKSTKKFCSCECQHEWQRHQVGELNARCTSVKIKCDYCGEEHLVKRYKIESQNNHFCSKECRQKWYSEIWSQSPEWREKSRERAANILKNNKKITMTVPQQIVNEMLDKLGIRYENERPFKYYAVDNYLIDSGLIIEVMGDYWHGNPVKYQEINHDHQLNSAKRDKSKHTYLKRCHGVDVLYLWETDILHNPHLCEALISLYINNNGVLEEYHSFNYRYENGVLSQADDRIIPYQEMSATQVKKYVRIAS